MRSGSVARYDPGEPPERGDSRPPESEHSRAVALALAVVGGVFGLHRFYTGRTQSGIWMCLTLGGMGIWYLYDVVVVAAGDFRDGDGRRGVRGGVSHAGIGPRASDRRVSELEDRMLRVRAQGGGAAG